ncbi:hypothetical protein [Marinisporobacter balticus]|uniref:Uncharacterized protein n=1 Tax=Marinisporobacter balticus TaxID=2018667 RepID=A0A4R2L0M5_9FIRM|nr:hypothetical protein [Marinisporobacter balticus]TCO79092.1 hypothetical protein EV214_103144 [Marinisporobacter balticus]
MKFKEIFPKYESYNTNDMNMNNLDMNLVKDICSILPDGIKERSRNYTGRGRLAVDSLMVELCNLVSKYASSERTANWGWDFILNDYYEYIYGFKNKKFHRFMDFVSEAIFTITDNSSIYDVNDILEEHNIGYRLVDNREKPWVLADSIDMANIEDTIECLEEISSQAVEHIKQAKSQLKDIDNIRARKDAIRDCLSATETVIKKITGEKSYEKAAEYFRINEKDWGPKFIVGDCINIWKRFHNEYKDIRHGDAYISALTFEETIYYIDRILAFVNYIVKKAEINGQVNA